LDNNSDNTTANTSFEDTFKGAVMIEQVTHANIAASESLITVEEEKKDENWLKDTLFESAAIYRNMFIVSIIVNLLMLALPIIAMTAFDMAADGNKGMVWPVAIGAIACYLYIVAFLSIRSHFLGVAAVEAPPSVASFFAADTLPAFIDVPFAVLSVSLIAYLGGVLSVMPLVTLLLIVAYMAFFADKRAKEQTSTVLRLLLGLNVIIVLSLGVLQVNANAMSVGTLLAVLLLCWHMTAMLSKIPSAIGSYKKAKYSYENNEKTLKLSIEYGNTDGKSEPSTRIVAWTALSLVLVLLVWASVVSIDESVQGSAIVTPQNKIQKIQSIESGVIDKLLVKEGDKVEVNQTIAKLSIGSYGAKATENRIKLYELMAKAARLTAENESREFIPSAELAKGIPHSVKREQTLFLKDIQTYLTSLEVAKNQLKQAGANEIRIKEANAKIAQIRTAFKTKIAKELSILSPEIDKLKATQKQLDEKVANCNIVSPAKGIIKTLYIEEDDAVDSFDDIADLEPAIDSFVIDGTIKASDIVFVKPTQDAIIKIGMQSVSGKVIFVSADTIKNEKNEKFYTVKIKIDKPAIQQLSGTATVQIAIGKQSLLGRAIKPIFKR